MGAPGPARRLRGRGEARRAGAPRRAARLGVGAGPLGCLLAPSLRLRRNGQKMAKSGGGGGGGGSGGLTWVVSCGAVFCCLWGLLFFF